MAPVQQDLDIPTFLRSRSPADPATGAPNRSTSVARPAKSAVPTGSASPDLRAARGRVDWIGNLEALRRGELQGNVPPDVLVHLKAVAKLKAVQDLAAFLGVTAEAVAVALLARAEAASNRGAACLARVVLGPIDEAKVEAAARAVGL